MYLYLEILLIRNKKSIIEEKNKTMLTSNTILYQQKRFRGKINIQKPREPHYFRALVNEFLTPFYLNPNHGKTSEEMCIETRQRADTMRKTVTYNPYEIIIAREIRNWFDNSKMVAICHQNSITEEELFEFKVPLKRANMDFKRYSPKLMKLALEDSPYAATLPLYTSKFSIVFGSDTNVAAFEKIKKKFPQLILLAGILEGYVLSKDDFLKYGKTDLTTSRARLVQVLQSAAGNNLNQQLTYHQSTLVSRLKQIGTNETASSENEESMPV